MEKLFTHTSEFTSCLKMYIKENTRGDDVEIAFFQFYTSAKSSIFPSKVINSKLNP